MNCLEFENLLDQGEPERLPAVAREHAGECARCARARARARSLEQALTRHFASELTPDEHLPAAFIERVMTRVQRGEANGVRWLLLPDALPWWARIAAEPSVALAAAVAALLLWRGDRLLTHWPAWLSYAALADRASDGLAVLRLEDLTHALVTAFVPAPGTHWSVVTAMAIGIAPALALAAYGLWRMGEKLADPSGGFAAIR